MRRLIQLVSQWISLPGKRNSDSLILTVDSSTFEVDGQRFAWGITLAELRAQISNPAKLPSYGWSHVQVKCASVFGLATTFFTARSPHEDKPVLQLHYGVTPCETKSPRELHVPYLYQLEKVLGKPMKSRAYYDDPHSIRQRMSDAVIYVANWIIGDIKITLSVYGGVRTEEDGSAAGIFIDWTNEIEAGRPLREKMRAYEQLLAAHIDSNISVSKVKLQYAPRCFHIANHSMPDPYAATKDHELRTAQLALYKVALFPTPLVIQNKLDDYEIGLYIIDGLNKIIVSTKWDSVELDRGDEKDLVYYDVLPGRSPGERELVLKELEVSDAQQSKALLQFVEMIESMAGFRVKRSERHGD